MAWRASVPWQDHVPATVPRSVVLAPDGDARPCRSDARSGTRRGPRHSGPVVAAAGIPIVRVWRVWRSSAWPPRFGRPRPVPLHRAVGSCVSDQMLAQRAVCAVDGAARLRGSVRAHARSRQPGREPIRCRANCASGRIQLRYRSARASREGCQIAYGSPGEHLINWPERGRLRRLFGRVGRPGLGPGRPGPLRWLRFEAGAAQVPEPLKCDALLVGHGDRRTDLDSKTGKVLGGDDPADLFADVRAGIRVGLVRGHLSASRGRSSAGPWAWRFVA